MKTIDQSKGRQAADSGVAMAASPTTARQDVPRRLRRKLRQAAFRVSAIFLLVSIAWILLSDLVVFDFLPSDDSGFLASLLKGSAYVAVTAVIIYALIVRETRRRLESEEELLANQMRLDLAVGSVGGGEWDWDLPSGRIFIAPRLKLIIGEPDLPDGIEAWQDRIHPDDLPALRESVARVLRGETDIHEAEYRIRHADGDVRWIATRGRALRDDAGRPVRLTGLDFDVTGRKAAEKALSDSEEHFRAVFEQSAVGLVLFTLDGRTLKANAKLAGFLGYTPEEMVGKTFVELTHAPDVAVSSAYFGNALVSADGTYGLEKRYVRKDGRVVWGRVAATLLRDQRGQPEHFIAVVEDIDERKRFEESLLRANRSLSLLSRCNEILVQAAGERDLLDRVARLMIDVGGYRFACIALAEAGGAELRPAAAAGTDSRRLDGRRAAAALSEPDRSPALDALRTGRPIAVGTDGGPEGRRSLVAGDPILASAYLPLAGDTALGVLTVHAAEPDSFAEEELSLLADLARDLGYGLTALRERRRREAAEKAARDSARLLGLLMESTAEAIIGVDAACRITFCNRSSLRLLGGADAGAFIGAALHDTLHARFQTRAFEERYCPLCTAVRKGEAISGEDLELRLDERDLAMEYLSRPIRREGRLQGAVIAMLDVSRRRAAEEQVRHAQKLEAVGQLTGGVAHDFNNLLAIIVGNLELLEERLSDEPDKLSLARQAIRAADRGAELTRHLLAFSRKQPLSPQPVDLNERLQDVVGMLRRTLGEPIEIELVRSPSLWKCEVDPAQLESLLLNLALNARDAMPDGGTLTLETANSRLDEDYAAANGDIAAGQYVMLAVTDTGDGMSPEVVARAFEPFFTTKSVGRGSGLGLSMVYGFVKQSGGHIKIYSEPDEGTTVRIYLPRTRISVEEAEPAGRRPSHPVDGTRVLVVEDDAEVCASTLALLEAAGCRAEAVPDAETALARLDDGEDFDLLFTDVVLPGTMNGGDLARAVKARRPGMRLLFTSGYTENAIVHHGRLDDGVEFIAKPYRRAELMRRLEKLLAEGDRR
jgi:PAS domain S-box-containing protein